MLFTIVYIIFYVDVRRIRYVMLFHISLTFILFIIPGIPKSIIDNICMFKLQENSNQENNPEIKIYNIVKCDYHIIIQLTFQSIKILFDNQSIFYNCSACLGWT